MKPEYQSVLTKLQLLDRLADLKPVVIGTPPLGIAVDSSDIDIACQSSSLNLFKQRVHEEYGKEKNFTCYKLSTRGQQAMCASFLFQLWVIELFCQTIPIADQWGVRHYNVERRLLRLAPQLRRQILLLKSTGVKTEPAFAKVLRLQGDPYESVLKLENKTDDELIELID